MHACIVHNMRMLCRCVHVCFVHNMRILRWVVHVCSVHNMRVFDGACAGMQHAQYAHVRVFGWVCARIIMYVSCTIWACLGRCVHVCSVHNMRILRWVVHVCSMHNMRVHVCSAHIYIHILCACLDRWVHE